MKNIASCVKTLVLLTTFAFAGHALATQDFWFSGTAANGELTEDGATWLSPRPDGVTISADELQLDLEAGAVFSLTPTNAIADIADKFTRNEILSPNEVRSIVGFKPSADPKADELRNRNISQSSEEIAAQNAGIYNNPAIDYGRRIADSMYRK